MYVCNNPKTIKIKEKNKAKPKIYNKIKVTLNH